MTGKFIGEMEASISALETLRDSNIMKFLNPLTIILFIFLIIIVAIMIVKIYNGDDGDEIFPYCSILALVLLLFFSFKLFNTISKNDFQYYNNKVTELQEQLDTYKETAYKREAMLSDIDEVLLKAKESQMNEAILLLEIESSEVGTSLTENIVIVKEELYKTTIEKCELATKALKK